MRSTKIYDVGSTRRNLFRKHANSKLPDPGRPVKAPVVLINGFSGVGKLTVAQHLRGMMRQGVKIFDHNYLTDAAGMSLGGNFWTEHFQNIVQSERRALLERLRLNDLEDADTAYIFTEISTRRPWTCKMPSQKPSLDYWEAVQDTYRPFISIILKCTMDELVERLYAPSRLENNKPWPVAIAPHYEIDLREREFEFGTSRELKLDISYMSPESAAECIRDHIEDLEQKPESLVHAPHIVFPPFEMTLGEKSIISSSPDPKSWFEEKRKPTAAKVIWMDPDDTEWDDVPWRPLPWKPLPKVIRRPSRRRAETAVVATDDVPGASETDWETVTEEDDVPQRPPPWKPLPWDLSPEARRRGLRKTAKTIVTTRDDVPASETDWETVSDE